MTDANTNRYISGAQALLNQLKVQKAEVPDEILRVQDLIECLDNNAKKIAAALMVNRRRGASSTGADTTAQLLKEQKELISSIAGLYEQMSNKPDLLSDQGT
ncbi:uncharacterized protein PHALS_05838 [Plasmopara halstedii]|uniref:Uncharacterized protein n=1 Tax=Plasmopara halstedii TaxID=4781 RepID=A0A0P1AAJ4_PLAHL|nr:uncharacterized protein PHALS_05838 [Plasmopara halstedii]CEG37782.1 hypothetical protein PHALS_05838 [Plasmopara halstedii]|eukprot:XP_024574151.1 hypothetical protein PHALS_05838 [Plasmopara halstedii]